MKATTSNFQKNIANSICFLMLMAAFSLTFQNCGMAGGGGAGGINSNSSPESEIERQRSSATTVEVEAGFGSNKMDPITIGDGINIETDPDGGGGGDLVEEDDEFVCGGLGEEAQGAGIRNGILASIYTPKPEYRSRAGSYFRNTSSFYGSRGRLMMDSVYFDNFNVTPRAFDSGFPLSSGDILRDESGTPIYEYFQLEFNANLVLPPDYQEGNYEIAIISDDGIRMIIDGNNHILNDSVHPPTLNCNVQGDTIRLNRESAVPFKLHYFQGPALHIALKVMWRKLDGSEPSGKGLCRAHTSLPGGGWEVIPPSAFVLPGNRANPCY